MWKIVTVKPGKPGQACRANECFAPLPS
jgi:hypothetical protein